MPPGKAGDSPSPDKYGAMRFISPWRSAGASHGWNAAPCESRCSRCPGRGRHRDGQTPARHKSCMAGATRTAMRPGRRGPFPHTSQPDSDQIGRGITHPLNEPWDRVDPRSPASSPEQLDHEAKRPPPQASRIGMPLTCRNQQERCVTASFVLRMAHGIRSARRASPAAAPFSGGNLCLRNLLVAARPAPRDGGRNRTFPQETGTWRT